MFKWQRIVMTFGLVMGMALATSCGPQQAVEEKEFEFELPLGLDASAIYVPDYNPMTYAKVSLGKQLYYDPRLSMDGTVACATCHNPRFGFSDGKPVSTGVEGKTGTRNSPTIINRLFSKEQFWDGRAADLEEQAKGPIENPVEMAFTHESTVERVRGIEGYQDQFRACFGTEEINIDHIAMAIAAFERTVMSGNSPYDRFNAGDTEAISTAAERGLAIFASKGNCLQCHSGFNFTDEKYHNIGVGMDKAEPDLGRFEVTGEDADRGAFRTPTLRDIALTAPYFHDGSAETLEEVMEYYNSGGIKNPQLSTHMKPLRLTATEQSDLIEFMKTLTGEISLATAAPDLPE
jgi:cytochrome c peroxidase